MEELYRILCSKNDTEEGLFQYEEGMKDLLEILIDENGYGLEEIIQSYD